MITDENIALADSQLSELKAELAEEAQLRGITAYAIAKTTGMNMNAAYRSLNPDERSDLTSLIVAGLSVGMELTWRPIQ